MIKAPNKNTAHVLDATNNSAKNTGGSSNTNESMDFAAQLSALNKAVSANPTAASRNATAVGSATNALNSANANAAAYQAQLDTLNANVANAKQNNWVKYMKALKALPQQMANNGINGGMTESSLVRLNASYGSANNDVDKQVLPDKTNLQTQLKAANETVEAAKDKVASAGNTSYITNAYGNILNNSQQAELNSIIKGMAALGYNDTQIQSALQKAGF